jgi:hypothetical protein
LKKYFQQFFKELGDKGWRLWTSPKEDRMGIRNWDRKYEELFAELGVDR